MAQSDVAQFREQQARQEEAARVGLSGPAVVSRHDFIEARAERGAERILQLLAQGRYAEAEAQMDLPGWGVDEAEEHVLSHVDTTGLR
jgi:DNA-nicking Smr family endonuclease